MNKVIGMGNALVDILTQIYDDSLLEELKLPKGSMQLVDIEHVGRVLNATTGMPRGQASGGSAANTIHGLASLGIETAFFGKVGKDEWGDFFRADLTQRHIFPLLLESENQSGRAFALISPDAERTFATFLGAAVELASHEVPDDLFNNYHLLHIEGYLVQNQELIRRALEVAKARGLKVSLDLASFNVVAENLDFLHEMVANYVDILFANEEEAKAFTGFKDEGEALSRMSEMCNLVVLKLGARGSLIKKGDEITQISALEANSVDTTGAGDLYAAGFLYGLIHNLSMQACGTIGALLAGKVIEVIGPKIDEHSWEAIRKQIAFMKN